MKNWKANNRRIDEKPEIAPTEEKNSLLEPRRQTKKSWLIIGVGLILLVLLFGTLGFFLLKDKSVSETQDIPIPIKIADTDKNVLLKNPRYANADLDAIFDEQSENNVLRFNLKSHPSVDYIKQVGAGNQVVMWYDVNSVYALENALGEPEFTDMRSGQLVQREWRYVYFGNETYQEPVYSCLNTTSANGTLTQSCSQTGTENKTREAWLPYNSREIPDKNIRIGVQVMNLRVGEWDDVVWVVGGKKIDRHAEFSVQETLTLSDSDTTVSVTAEHGVIFVVNAGVVNISMTNFTVIQVTKYSNSTTTKARLYERTAPQTGNLLQTVSFSGDVATFSVAINETKTYFATANSDGATHNMARDATPNFPYNGVHINVTGSVNIGNGEYTSHVENIKSITTLAEYVIDDLSVTLISPANNTIFTTNNINFSANVTGSATVSVSNVSLVINGTINETNTSGISGVYNFSKIINDGNHNWTVIAFGNDSIQYNATNGTLLFTIDLVEPTVTLYDPANATESNRETWYLISNLTHGNYTLNNATLNVWFSNGTLFNQTINTSIAGTSDVDVNYTLTDVPFGETYLWNVLVNFENPTLGTFNSVQAAQNFTFTRLPFEVTGESFNPTALETDSETFFVNISTINNILSTTFKLNYDGTEYFTETNCVAGFCELMRTIDIPLVSSGENENKTFFWELTLFSIDNQVFEFNTSEQGQNVSRIHLEVQNATYNNRTLNFTTWRESNRTNLSPMSFKATFDSWLGTGTVKRTSFFENTSADVGIQLAIDPANRTFRTDATIEYNAVGVHNGTYKQRNYHFQNASLTNESQNIRLFLLNSSEATSFIQRVTDTSQIAQVGVLIFQQRYYPEDNSFETVAISKTDNAGESIGFYHAEIPDYRHIITRNGTVLKTTERGKIFPQSSPFTLTFIIGETLEKPWEVFEGISNIVSSLTFNETSGIVTYEWIDTTGALTIANLTVYRVQSNQSNINFCSVSSQLTAGSLTCNLSGQDGTFLASGYIGRSPSVLDKLITITISAIKDVLAQPFLLLWIIFLIAVIGMSLFYPPAGLILTSVVLALGVIMGIVAISWLFVFAIIAIAIWILIET